MHPSGKARINGTSIFLPKAPVDNDDSKKTRRLLASIANLAEHLETWQAGRA